MNQPKVSLIVPIFNVAPWLGPCLKSVQRQTLTEWEAILVDDSSTDGSADIAKKFAAEDPRFRFFTHEKNLGLGGSRNTGVEQARGEFLFFLDSDDLLARTTLSSMAALADESGADLVIGDFHEFRDGGPEPSTDTEQAARDIFKKIFSADPTVFDWRRYRDDYSTLMASIFSTTCCGKLFRRDLWNRLGCRVPENLRMAEDFIPVKRFFFSAPKIASYPRAALLYRKRAGSATMKRSRKAFEILKAYPHAIRMFEEVGVKDELSAEIEIFFLRSFRDHLLNLLPFKDWWSFYRQSGALVATMAYPRRHESLEGINLGAWIKAEKSGLVQIIKFGLKQRTAALLTRLSLR